MGTITSYKSAANGPSCYSWRWTAKHSLRRQPETVGRNAGYNVGMEHRENFSAGGVKKSVQPQKKAQAITANFGPARIKKQDYSLEQIDLFAA